MAFFRLAAAADNDSEGLSNTKTSWVETQEELGVKAIIVTERDAGLDGMTLMQRSEPQAAINDAVVRVYSSGLS